MDFHSTITSQNRFAHNHPTWRSRDTHMHPTESSDEDDKWTLLNNTEKDTSDSPSKYTNIHLWLPTKKLFDEFDEAYINTNSNDIILNIVQSVYGSNQSFIHQLLNQQSEKQLIDTYEILKKEKIKYDEMNDNNTDTIAKYKNFNKLSVPSITNICSYLTKTDINCFKLVNTSLAIQCLLEMKKYQDIGVFNGTQLPTYYKYKYLSYFSAFKSVHSLFTFDRYSGSLRYNQSLLIEKWANKYEIPNKHLMFLRFKIKKTKKKIISKMLNNSDLISYILKYSDIIHSGAKEFIFDSVSEHFVLLFDDRFILNVPNESIDGLNYDKYSMVLLNYFDIKQQKISFIQTLLVNQNLNSGDLKIFIENILESLLKPVLTESEWKEVENFKKIKLFSGDMSFLKAKRAKCIANNQIIIFQIDNSEYIEKYRKYYADINESFYTNPNCLNSDILRKLQLKPVRECDFVSTQNFDQFPPSIITNIYTFLNIFDIPKYCVLSTAISIVCIKEIRQRKQELSTLSKIFNALSSEKKTITQYIPYISDDTKLRDLVLRNGIMDVLVQKCKKWRDASNVDFVGGMSQLLLHLCKNHRRSMPWECTQKLLECFKYLLTEMTVNYIRNDIFTNFGLTVCHFTEDSESNINLLQCMSEYGLITELVNLLNVRRLSDDDNAKTKMVSTVLRAIDNIAAGSNEEVKYILECGVLGTFCEILKSEFVFVHTKKLVCFILSNICASDDYKQIELVINCDIFVSLVDFLENNVFALASEALWAIANATLPLKYSQIEYLVSLGVINAVFVFMGKINEECQANDKNQLVMVCLQLLENVLVSAKKEDMNRLSEYVEIVKQSNGWEMLQSMENNSKDYYYILSDAKHKISYLLQSFYRN